MLEKVKITPEVWAACWNHTLTTETEEVMGLLMGKEEGGVSKTLILSALKISRRITKQKDRVEIDHQDLIEAAEYAEKLSDERRVIGWYHSHPHVTVHPSHIDLATQASYQLMDKNFVGLIFSTYNFDKKKKIDIKEAIAFQTLNNNEERNLEIEVTSEEWTGDREKTVIEALTKTPDILKQEELEACCSFKSDDILNNVYNKGCLISQLSCQTSIVAAPMLQSLKARKLFLESKIDALKTEEQYLIYKLKKIKDGRTP